MNVIAFEVEALRAGPGAALAGSPDAEGSKGDAFRYLTALRQTPPDVKSFG